MNLYAVFTWLAVAVLGPGSILLFIVLVIHLWKHLHQEDES